MHFIKYKLINKIMQLKGNKVMAKKIIKNKAQFNICNYCMNYLLNDISGSPEELTVKDLKFVYLFHRISNPLIRQTIISLLENLQNENNNAG